MNEPKDIKDLDRMLIEAIQNGFSLFAWKSLNGVIEKCELKIKAIRKEMNELELELHERETVKIADIITGDRILDFYLPECSLSFRAGIKIILSEKKIKVFIPTEFNFFERRRHERVQPQKTCYYVFEINKVMVKKPLFDLGLGGVAIILPRTEKLNLKKGAHFPIGYLEIMGKKIKLTTECVSVISIDRYKLDTLPYGGNKFSFRFIDMSKEDREVLMGFIVLESILAQKLKGA